jgi:PAS domain S-box-containing protein
MKSTDELSAICRHAPGILLCVAVDPDGEFRFVSMSDAGLAAMGLSHDQVVGARVRDVIPPPSCDAVLGHYREAIRSRDTVRWREVSDYPSGRKVGEVAVTPLYDDAGVATHLIGVVHDITERERLEEALRHREERLAFLLQLNDALRPLSDASEIQQATVRLLCEHLGANRVAYSVIDGDEFFVTADHNRDTAPFRGRWPIALFGEALFEAYRRGESVMSSDVRSDPRFTEAERATLLRHDIAALFRVPIRKEGRWVASVGVNNATPREWTRDERALIEQTAERLWSAAERARAEAALRDREERLRLALRASAAGSWTRDVGANSVEWDEGFRRLYGIPADQPADFDLWMNRIHEADRHVVLGLIDDMRHPTSDAWDVTFRIVRPDATVAWIHSVGRVERDATGQISRLAGLEMDVTARRQAETILQAQREQADITERLQRTAELEQRTAQLSRLASDLTLAEHRGREEAAKLLHDGLQQLLVIASLNLAQHVKHAREAAAPLDDRIVEAKQQVDDAIAAARTLSFELSPPVLQHAELPASLAWLANWTQQKYGVEVRVSADPRARSSRKDVRTLLFESTRELLFNAVKHAQVDRVTLEIGLDADDQLCITVTDSGVGFDPSALADRMKAGAVGWGLFSIRERVTLLGGRFEIASAPGRGARFRLVAPRSPGVDVTARPESFPAAAIEPPAARVAAGALRILLVDDHAAVREAFREILHQHAGLLVVGNAADGIEAVAQARALRPDVILMDISMPRLDGIEATRLIHAELPLIPILGLSMQPSSDAPHAIERAGAAGFFIKGTDTQRLIDYLLELRRTSPTGPAAPPSDRRL